MSIGFNIKSLRIQQNMTQQELAEKLFVKRNAISKWEQGRGMPSIDNVQALSKTFNVSIESLLTPQEVPLNLNKITIFIMIISTMMIILYFVPWQTDWSFFRVIIRGIIKNSYSVNMSSFIMFWSGRGESNPHFMLGKHV